MGTPFELPKSYRRRIRYRFRPLFAWYDLWIGVFIDTKRRAVYVLPLPCVGFVISWDVAHSISQTDRNALTRADGK